MRSDKIPVPTCISEGIEGAEWFEEYDRKEGGAVDKGPDPPAPPVMNLDTVVQYPSLHDDIDGTEAESKTKMAFAKMQVPLELRGSFHIPEEEYQIKLIDNDDDEKEPGELVLGEEFDVTTEPTIALPGEAVAQAKSDSRGGGSSKGKKAIKGSPLKLTRHNSKTEDSSARSRLSSVGKAEGKGTVDSDEGFHKNDSDDFLAPVKPKAKRGIRVSEKAAQLGLYA